MRKRRLSCEPLEQRAMLSVVLDGDVLDLGINDDGSLITAPWYAGGVGASFNGEEILTWGTPLSLISVAADGMVYTNLAPLGSVNPFPATVTDTSSGDTLSALVTGEITPGLEFERTISFADDGSVVTFTITLTNNTSTVFQDVAFTEGVDPDQGYNFGDGYRTYNDVVLDGQFVRSYRVEDGTPTLTFGIGSTDPKATVSVEPFSPNPFDTIDDVYDPDGAFEDGNLHVAFDFGDLAPGESVTAQYAIVVAGTPEEADLLFGGDPGEPPSNGAPVADDDSFTVDEDGVLTITAAELLSNDTDPDGDALAISEVEHHSHGVLVQNPDGTFTYTPDPDFYGTDTFQYEVSDGNGGFDTATVTITVNSVIDAVIDIKPGNGSINLNSNGVLGVAILTTSTADGDAENFDAASLADASLESFGLGDAEGGEAVQPLRTVLEDVDGDGDLDLLLHFSMRELKDSGILRAGSVDLVLSGEFGGAATGLDLLGYATVDVKGAKADELGQRAHANGLTRPGHGPRR